MAQASDDYLHGFSEEEQRRLIDQAAFLEPWSYTGLQLPQRGRLLELGAGVGAQTRLLRQHTTATVVSLERDGRQLAALHRNLGQALALGGDARELPFREASLDGAFICWVLEHVPGPARALAEVYRVLRPGAPVAALEVQNNSLSVAPRQPALERYWAAVNRTQEALGGDPYLGLRLGGLLHRAGFEEVRVEWVPIHGDAADPEPRAGILAYFHRLLRSSAPAVRAHGLGWPGMEEELDQAFAALQADPDAAFLYTFARATARRPGGP